jgi:hypothetical protein
MKKIIMLKNKPCVKCAYRDDSSNHCLKSYSNIGYIDPVTGVKSDFLNCYQAICETCGKERKYFSERSKFREKMKHLFQSGHWKQNFSKIF